MELHWPAGATATAGFRGNDPLAQPLTFSGPLPPKRFNLARYCLAEKAAEKTALIVAGHATERWTYGVLEDVVLRMAEGLRRNGICDGERLFIRMGNTLDYALMFFAANAAGAVPIPASPMLTIHEVARLIADAKPRAVAWDGSLTIPHHDLVLSPEDIRTLKTTARGHYAATAKDDPGYMVYTSGTSGTPKGVLHAQRAAWGRRPMYQGWYGISAADVMLHTGAFNWTYTLGTGLCDVFANSATAVIHTARPDIAVWPHLMAQHGVTIFASVPGIYRQLLRTDFALPATFRHGLAAGEALPVPILEAWRARTGRELFEAIGMSEISTYVSSSPDVAVKPGSPGKPQPGRAVRILDDGQLGVHTTDPGLMLGYWNEEPLSGEWFATGDAAHIDDEGYVWHHGRMDDLMNAGGYRVSPLEVEAVLAQHPAVAEVAVKEHRVSESLSIILGFVVPKDGFAPEPSQLLAFASNRLAAYKCPKDIHLLAALPRTANGKIIRKALSP
jgi:acyl-coenzyme A synthetase/AMP-(fatty) acid ligase